jgi:hypothetical protein
MAFLATSALAPIAPVAASAPAVTALVLDSDTGDFIGQGLLYDDEPAVVTGSGTAGSLMMGASGWSLAFRGPDGAALVPGTYEDAQGAPFAAPGHPGLDIYGQGRGCNTLTGRFQVLEGPTFDGTGNATAFAVDFEQHCEGGAPALRGALRLNSTVPIALVRATAVAFGDHSVGTTSSPSATVVSNPLVASTSVSSVSLAGANPGDFAIGSNGCASVTLNQGNTCSIELTFSPSIVGVRTALAVLDLSGGGTRTVALTGRGLTPTTTTLDGPSSPVDAPDPASFTVHVTPAPSGDPGYTTAVMLAVDGGSPAPFPLQPDGSAIVDMPIAAGSHSVTASFAGIGLFGPSSSNSVPILVGSSTTTTLTADLNPVQTTQHVTLTASVGGKTGTSGTSAPPTAGSLTIRDATTSTVLGTKVVGPGDTTLVVTTSLTLGSHDLVAEYIGSGVFRSSQTDVAETVVLDQAVDATSLGVSTTTFYPVTDGYRDGLTVRGTLHEPATVTIRIYSVATGRIVRQVSLGSKSAAYAWVWNGRSSAGMLLAAGKYRVTQTLVDTGKNTLTATAYTTISLKRLYWSTGSKSLYGTQFSIHGDPGDGTISASSSSYYHGARISSGHSWVALSYAFSIPSATVYGNVSFKVLGRSPNGRKAIIGVWNPAYGSYQYVDNYDAAKLVGPGYATYATSAALLTHRGAGYVRGLVFVEYAGGIVTFDVAKVSVSYRYAILK